MAMIAAIVVVTFGVFLWGLAMAIIVRPRLAERFFNGFASSARTHYAEQVVRLVLGAALVVRAPEMWQATSFRILGWLIVITAVGLLCIPWRWHQRFARRVIPPLIRHMRPYALLLLAFGALLIFGVIAGA